MMDQISDGVGAVTLESTEGTWEVAARKPKNRGGNNASNKPWSQQNTAPRAWGQPASRESNFSKAPTSAWPPMGSAGRGNVKHQSSSRAFPTNSVAPRQPAVAAPLEHGWSWNTRGGAGTRSVQVGSGANEIHQHVDPPTVEDAYIDNDDDSDADGSNDELLSDDFDSDASDQSFESRKNNKWLKAFFLMLDKLTVEEIHEPARQWHCPACQGGPGAIDWYRGLQPLVTHAKTKGSKRVKLHRELAELLDEELQRRGTSIIPAGEAFGKWKGLKDTVKDREIVWPPMVVIMNTKLEQDENDKWIGMGNQELLDYFSEYAAVRARHSYGPQGHRGMSMLIFESSAIGYLEAERLNEHFKKQGTDREAWDHRRVLLCARGERQLYGYMAEKQDLNFFNQHSAGKSGLKYEMKSYQEMVVRQLKQMNEDNQQLIWFKDRLAKEKKHSKALGESFGLVSEKLRRTSEENRIVRQKMKAHNEQNKQEMDFQEDFFKCQLKNIHDARDAMEDSFERLQQEERQKVKHSKARREDEVVNFIKSQEKEMEEFVGERDKLMKIYEEERAAMKQRHHEEEIELEKKFDAQLNELMAKYTPHHSL